MATQMKRILLIEDDVDFLRAFYARLVEEGYDVAVAGKAEGAKRWSTDKDIGFEMIISDQRMPGEAGASFLGFLAELEKTDVEKLDPSSPLYREVRERFSNLNDAEFKEMLRNIKVHPHIRVILSGYSEDDGIQKSLKEGKLHAFISKQTPMKEILATVRSLLEKPRPL